MQNGVSTAYLSRRQLALRKIDFSGRRTLAMTLGLSRRAQSLGTENAFVVLAEVNKLIAKGYDITSFCIGQPDFPAPTHVQDAGHEAITLD